MVLFFSLPPDEQAFADQLFQDHHQLMYNIAYRILQSREKAEEAVQDAFIRIMNHMERIRQIPGPQRRPFCVVIVKNVSLNILRKEKRMVYMEDVQLLSDQSGEDDVEQAFFQAEEKAVLLQAMDRLSPQDKMILQLHWGRAMGFRQIGLLLDIKEEAAKKRGQRALDKLRAAIHKEIAGHG